MKHSSTKIIPVDSFARYRRKKTLKGYRVLTTEEDLGDNLELNLSKTKIEDSMPIHVGNAILAYSKVHFLKFIKFLRDHLRPGSYKLAYADTDSIAIGTTGSFHYEGDDRKEKIRRMFEPMLKIDMKASFFENWHEWFVLSDRVEDLRKPGLLKGKFTVILIICLLFIFSGI